MIRKTPTKSIFWAVFVLSSILLPFNGLWARMESTNFIIWADVFNSGGTEDSESANFKIQDSIGEGEILSNTSTSASWGIKAGFREMYPDYYLTLSVGSNSINLGTLSSSLATAASHTMNVDTNATNGFSVTLTGNTLTSGVNTIDGIGATAAASAPGSEQFGINLVANANPAIGADPAGAAPIGSAANQYREADKFAFNNGAVIATSSVPINPTVFTVSYLTNISNSSVAGSYNTTLTYSATANF
jgi:hypothetical protein